MARQPLVISDPDLEYDIHQYADFFRDPTGQITIDRIIIQHKNDFIPAEDNVLNFGFTDDAIWIKFHVVNKNSHIDQWLMEIKYYFLWYIDLYILNDQQIVTYKKSGIQTPFETVDMAYRWYMFNLLLKPDKDYTFFMRFKTDMPMTLPISIKTWKNFVQQSYKLNFMKGSFYGILLLIVLFHLYLFGTQKEKNHLYFLALILTLFCIRFTFDGFTRQVFFGKYHQLNSIFTHYFPILIPTLFIWGLLFVSSFSMAEKMPPLFKYVFLIMKMIWFILAGCILLGFSFIIPVFPVCAVCTIVIFVFFFLFLWKEGYSPAYYYLFGWVFLVTGFVSFSLLRLNFIPSNMFTESSMEMCILGMVLCFQFSFIHQTNLIKKQEQLSQLKLIKQAEENKLLILNQKTMLEKKVKQRTSELQDAIEKAEKANSDRLNFFASLNHDLRTPLNSILGYAQIFQYGNKPPQELQKGFQSIYESADYLLSLINDLMDISKIESSSFELFPDTVHVSSFINRVIKLIRVLAHQKNILFTTSIDNNLPDAIIADEKRFNQVLINLLGNAVKFTDKGEVSFCVKSYHDNNGLKDSKTVSIYFEIKDTGPGIDKNKLEKIFEPFRQVGKKDKKHEGAGLGLSISQSIVRLMGGTIFAESTPGEGSKFWFQITFPLVIEKISQPTETGEIPIFISDPPKKILIADDILHNRIILHEFLTLFQCDTQLAKDGNDCIQKAIETKPDLILMDIQMPMMDGIQALKLIKKLDEIKHIPVIAVSASVTGMTRQSIIQEGFDDFISKPVDMDELATIIQKHLDVDIQYVEFDNLKKQSLNEINPKTIKKTNDIEIIKKLPIIDIKKAMSNLRNDDVLFKQILELAIEDIPNYLNSLKHDFDKREPENIKQQAHKLKSSFRLIAAKRCEALVDLITHKSIRMEYEFTDIHALEREWHRLVQQVKQMIQGQKI
jgi:signal transduction histidine kinase/DNA-binding NarL/FixJ family response regulator